MSPLRRRRPVRRTAVVGGAAYAGKKYGERKGKQGSPDPEDRPQPSDTADTLEQLKKLGELRDSGVLTDEEFEAQKRKIPGS